MGASGRGLLVRVGRAQVELEAVADRERDRQVS